MIFNVFTGDAFKWLLCGPSSIVGERQGASSSPIVSVVPSSVSSMDLRAGRAGVFTRRRRPHFHFYSLLPFYLRSLALNLVRYLF